MASAAQSTTSQATSIANGDIHPPSTAAKKGKGKKDKPGVDEKSKLVAARLAQLEQDAAGEKDQQAEVEREVKKATRDLNQLISNIESPLTRLEIVHKKYEELLNEMK